MIEPLYYWQTTNCRCKPFHDMAEEEFDKRLEQLIRDLEYAERLGDTQWLLKMA